MGSVLVAQGDDIILSKGYGSANLEWSITPIVQKPISFVGEPSFNRCLHPLDSFLLVLLFQVALQTGLFNVVPVLSGLAD